MSGRATAIALESKKNQHLEAALVFTVLAHAVAGCKMVVEFGSRNNRRYYLFCRILANALGVGELSR